MVRVILVALALLIVGCKDTSRLSEDAADYSDMLIEARGIRAFDKYTSWINACRYTKYTCAALKTPRVVYKQLRPGLLGYYDGGDTIYIKLGVRGWLRKEILMHESVHYIQKHIGGLVVPGPPYGICKAEAEAFGAVDKWLIDNGKNNMVVGPDWWKPYTHCWKWYDPNWNTYSGFDRFIWSIH